MSSILRSIGFAGILLLPSVCAAAEVVTTCGQLAEGAAVLTADLDCTGSANRAIVLTDGSLDLAGHTLAADVVCQSRPSLDQRAGDCVIRGPGILRGCVRGYRLQVHGVTLSYANGLCADLEAAVYGWRSTTITRSEVSGYPVGGINSILDSKMRIVDSVVQHTGVYGPAVSSGRLLIRRSQVNGEIVFGSRAVLKDTSVEGVGPIYDGLQAYGLYPSAVKLVRSSITGMAKVGIRAGRVVLQGSEVTSNCGSAAPGCHDIVAEVDLRASSGSTCGSSFCEAMGSGCGVCAGD